MIRLHWLLVIVMSCGLALSACAKPRAYERHVEMAYDENGHRLVGYATLNIEYLDALLKDLDACYADKRP